MSDLQHGCDLSKQNRISGEEKGRDEGPSMNSWPAIQEVPAFRKH
jgi:hypothetical protein